MEISVAEKPSDELGLHQNKKSKKEKKPTMTKRERQKITKYLRKVWEFRDVRGTNRENYMSCALGGDKSGKSTILLYYTLGAGDCELLNLPREFVNRRFVIEIKKVKSTKAKFIHTVSQ